MVNIAEIEGFDRLPNSVALPLLGVLTKFTVECLAHGPDGISEAEIEGVMRQLNALFELDVNDSFGHSVLTICLSDYRACVQRIEQVFAGAVTQESAGEGGDQ